MELDKIIIEGKKPLDCFDAENKELIKPFLNKDGYFSNNLENFCLLDGCFKLFLSNVFKDLKSCFIDDKGRDWKFFLPVEWVKEPEKEPEKKYRAFTLAEWIEQHEIGEVIHYRSKPEGIEFRFMYMGYAHGIGKNIKDVGVGAVTLGLASYTLDYLFEDCEIEVNGKWQPFGVIDRSM